MATTTLQLQLHVNLDGLAPDPHEFDPSLGHYGTFGNDRFANLVPQSAAQQVGQEVITLSDYTLPPYDELRGDETVCFQQLAKTRLSGIPELDAMESDYETRTAQCGLTTIPLQLVLQSALQRQPLASDFVDNITQRTLYSASVKPKQSLTQEQHDALMQETLLGATKGHVTRLETTVSNRTEAQRYADRLAALVQRSETDYSSPLLYGTKRYQEGLDETERIITKYYCKAVVGPRSRFPNASTPLMKELHMPFYVTNFGTTLPIVYFCPRNTPRLQVPKSNINTNALYQQTTETWRFYERCAVSALASVGLSREGTIDIIRKQHNDQVSEFASPMYLRAVKGLVRLMQMPAHELKYTSDARVPNPAFLHLHQRGGNATSAAASSMKGRRGRGRIGWCTFKQGGQGGEGGEGGDENSTTPQFEMATESFDDLAEYGMTRSSDCEDDQKVCSTMAHEILPLTSTALAPEMAASSPLLAALASVLERYDVCSMGSEVTTPFLNTKVKDGEQPKMEDQANGHVFGHLVPRVLVGALTAKDGYDIEKRIPAYFERRSSDGKSITWQRMPYEYNLPVHTIEGTGPGNDLVRPSAEVHPSIYAANVASRKVFRSLPSLGRKDAELEGSSRTLQPSEFSTLARTFRPEQLPDHDELPARADDRVDGFYKGNLHFLSPRLFELDPRLAHLVLVDTKTRSHGVDFGRFIRQTANSVTKDKDSSMALVAPYLDATDAEMNTLLTTAAVIKNMLPAVSMGRFPAAVSPFKRPHTVISDFSTACLRVGHPLPDLAFAALSHYALRPKAPASAWTSLVDALDGYSRGLHLKAMKKQVTFAVADRRKNVNDINNSTISDLVVGVPSALTPHLDRSDRTVFCLYAPAWQAANADMARIDHELKDLYARNLIVAHGFSRSRVLSQCGDTITLTLVVPVVTATGGEKN